MTAPMERVRRPAGGSRGASSSPAPGRGRAAASDALRPRLAPGAALRWLVDEWRWPYAGALAACFLLVVFPVLWSAEGLALALVFLQLPVYLLHQLEEHAGDLFRRYVNARLGQGREVLGRPLTFSINALCVWVPFCVALLLAVYVDLGLGLIAVYLSAANALAHVAATLASRAYNPGLCTAVGLLAPASAAGAYEVGAAVGPSLAVQLLAAGIAIGAHVALIALILARARAPRGRAP